MGDRMVAKGDMSSLQCLPHLGFPSGAARVSHLMLPRDKRQQGLPGPPPPHGGEGRLVPIKPDPFPPEVHEGREGRQLLSDLLHGALTGGKLRALGSRFDGLNFRLQATLDRLGRLGRGVQETERVQRERQRLQVVPLRATHLFPALPVGSTRLHRRPGFWVVMIRLGQLRVSRKGILGCLQRLWGLSSFSGQRQGVALDKVMHARKAVRHTPASQALFGAFNAGLCPVTHQGQDPGAQGGEPLVHQRFPRGVRAIVCDVLPQQLPGRHVLKDQHHAFQEGCVDGPNALSHLARRSPILLPGPCRLKHRALQGMHHAP